MISPEELDALLMEPWLLGLREVCTEAVSLAGKQLEALEGN